MSGAISQGHTELGYLHMRDHRTDVAPQLQDVISFAKMKIHAGDDGKTLEWGGGSTAIFVGPVNGDSPAGAEFAQGQPRDDGLWGGGVVAAAKHASGIWPLYNDSQLDPRFREIIDITASDEGAPEEGNGFLRIADARNVPDGTAFLLTAGTDEYRQEIIAFPLHQLIAQHDGNESPKYSTPLYEIAGDALDEDRAGGLHSFWRVFEQPEDGNLMELDNVFVPAWNCTRSSGDSTGYGAFVGIPFAVGEGLIGAFAGYEAFGPLMPGAFADKHRIGTNSDGVPWNSGHIDTDAYFFMDEVRDAPIDFERLRWPNPGEHPIPTLVHLVYDGASTHPFLDGPRPGKWRLYTTDPIRRPWSPPVKTPVKTPTETPTETPVWTQPPTEKEPINHKKNPVDPARSPYEVAFPSLYGIAIRLWDGIGSDDSHGYEGRFGGGDVDAGNSPDDARSGMFPNPNGIRIELGEAGESRIPPASQADKDYAEREFQRRLAKAESDESGETFTGPADGFSGRKAGFQNRGIGNEFQTARRWTHQPLGWHVQTIGESDGNGNYAHTSEAGDYYLTATVNSCAWFAPPEILYDGIEPSVASDVTLAVYGGLFRSTALGSPGKIGAGEASQSNGSIVDGWYFTSGDGAGGAVASDAVEAEMYFVDSSGSTRIGLFRIRGNIRTGGDISINSDNAPQRGRLRVDGTVSNIADGPHSEWFTSDDTSNARFQILPYAADNVAISFDSFYNGGNWKSADAGSNFQIYKVSDELKFRAKAGVAAGSNITWGEAFAVTRNANTKIKTLLFGGTASNIGMGLHADASITDAGTRTMTIGASEQVQFLTFAEKAGGYTYYIDLATTGAIAGNIFNLNLNLATDSGGNTTTVLIRNGSGGSTLATITNSMSGAILRDATCYFDGTNWRIKSLVATLA